MKDFFARKRAVLDKIDDELMGYYLRGHLRVPCSPEACPFHNGRIQTLLWRYYRVSAMQPGGLPRR